MSLSTRDIKLSLIVAPILAFLAWWLVGQFYKPRPAHLVAGESYPLSVHANCRIQSGGCTLENNNLRITIKAEELPQDYELTLESSHAINLMRFAIVDKNEVELSQHSQGLDSHKRKWRIALIPTFAEPRFFRLVIQVNQSWFYAEIPATFLKYRTSYDRDFR